jgi:hypothetical protein
LAKKRRLPHPVEKVGLGVCPERSKPDCPVHDTVKKTCNLKTAKALGLEVPLHLQQGADDG